MVTLENKRGFERFNAHVAAEVIWSDGTSLPVRIIDLSQGGFALTARKSMRSGIFFELELKIVTGDKMYFECQVMWSQMADPEGLHKIGAQARRIRERKIQKKSPQEQQEDTFPVI